VRVRRADCMQRHGERKVRELQSLEHWPLEQLLGARSNLILKCAFLGGHLCAGSAKHGDESRSDCKDIKSANRIEVLATMSEVRASATSYLLTQEFPFLLKRQRY